jgi:hypothetical protein
MVFNHNNQGINRLGFNAIEETIMKNLSLKAVFALLLIMTGVSLSACSTQPGQNYTTEYFHEQVIQEP